MDIKQVLLSLPKMRSTLGAQVQQHQYRISATMFAGAPTAGTARIASNRGLSLTAGLRWLSEELMISTLLLCSL